MKFISATFSQNLLKVYFYNTLLLIRRLLILVFLFQFCRLYFYIVNHSFYENLSTFEILKIFFFGTRFDVTAIIYYNLIFIILHLIPGNFQANRKFQTFQKTLFIAVNSLLILGNLADSHFFQFSNKRSTAEIFSSAIVNKDFTNLLPQYLIDYWFIILILIVLMTVSWFFYPKFKSVDTIHYSKNNIAFQVITSVVLLLCFIAIARGVQTKPTRIITAANYTDSENFPLILNSPFTVIATFQKEELRELHYFAENELKNIYKPEYFKSENCKPKKLNVVVIVLESFSKEYIGFYNHGKGFTPFLDSLISKSLSFDNSFANGKKSIEGIPAIVSGIPALMDNPYITSQYSANQITSLPGILKKFGYHTSFFHGGINGTMGFDYFAKLAGIDNYFGKNEYVGTEAFDGNWGIFDEEFFQFFAKKLSTFSEPFYSCIFSLSSHHPYPIPEKYKTRFPDGKIKILKSIAYTDFSLRKFFETASKSSWYANTLFVITADHTSQPMNVFYFNKIGVYSVPIIYFHPNNNELIGKSQIVTQHIDILPSVLEYLDVPGKYFAFGKSVFSSDNQHCVVNFNNDMFQIANDNKLLLFNGNEITAIYNYKPDRFLQKNLLNMKHQEDEELANYLKAILQTYNSSLIQNKMTE